MSRPSHYPRIPFSSVRSMPAARAHPMRIPTRACSLPRDSSETLALLLSPSLFCAVRYDHANGRPLVYRPTPRLLQLLGVETLEEARRKMRRAKPALDLLTNFT